MSMDNRVATSSTRILLMPRRALSETVAKLRGLAQSHDGPSTNDVQEAIAELPYCVFVADANGRLVAASNVALETVGHTLASLRALSVTDISGPNEPAERLWEAFHRERGQRGHYSLRPRNGIVATHYAASANVVGRFSVVVHIIANPT